ncbi:putative glycerol-3-phosphate acyltransferase 3 [Hibiscus syriacus]|uniref:Glycerol-3-phosphate acyltransferase 3 n=1 Tax=Hibiscus syriacus TaxID=106335 RepID=A0A6A3CD83_HIBSY|nr:putative glycerol-3-phosphate acyltransferase 3 [Hibiscus syriacus]
MFFPLKAFSLLFENLINTSGKLPYLRFKASNGTPAKQFKFVKNSSFTDEVSKHTLVFHLAGAVLKSHSQFPYFMLVAFQACGLIRALILLLLYPLACLLGHKLGLRLPVFVSFVGIKKDKFRAGAAIPPSSSSKMLSRFSEVISPIKTVRLTRNREKDKEVMQKMLSKGDLVVCSEGTTYREPYLLRFSPLFAELTDEIVPVAIKLQVSMFYGSTASGFKCLDSTFHRMNPNPSCMIMFLNKLPCWETNNAGGKSIFEVANHVQGQIATALGFDRTDLTRKDKYMILASNKGII